MENEKYVIISRRFSPDVFKYVLEIVMKNRCTVSDLPTDCAPGSLAYKVKADIPAYGFSADNTWENLREDS